jgi:hypothetical protein
MGIAPQDEAGDGTVPACSARAAAAHAEFSAEMNGFEHQGSYADLKVQDVTLYSVLKIAQKAT